MTGRLITPADATKTGGQGRIIQQARAYTTSINPSPQGGASRTQKAVHC